MPTYTYRRPDGTTFDVFQKMSDAPLAEDPETGVPVTRMISGGAGLQFKGSGFYLTDYVKKSGGDAADAPADADSKGKPEKKAPKAGPSDAAASKDAPAAKPAASSASDA